MSVRRGATRHKAKHRPSRRAGAAQGGDGFALLEVVIAFTILLIVMVPAAALYGQVIHIAANSRDRVQAANLAAQQIDAAEATSFTTLAGQVGATLTTTAKDAGMTYTLAQTSQMVDESSANACGGVGNGGGEQPILAVTETVTWLQMGSTNPVVTQTDIAAPPSYFSGSLGSLAVNVTDSQNNPVVAASVTMTNTESPYNTKTLPTGATGCMFYAPLATGTYNITVSDAGYVAPNEQTTATVTPLVSLGSGDTVPVPVSYAPEATVPISYTATAPILTATATSFASYPISINNSYLSASDPGMTFPAAAPQTLQLYGYNNGYDIFAGGCQDNDTNSTYAVTQSKTSPVTLNLNSLSLAVTITGLQPIKNPTITATDTSGTPSCSTNNLLAFSPTLIANAMNIALPQGAYTLAAQATLVSNGSTVSGTFSPASVTMTTGSKKTAVSFP